jgi:hypothetical protein
MDFKAPGPSGDIAIEAKGGHGSAVAARRQEILDQKGRQTAAEKYGFVLCYQMDGRPALKRKGSYVRVIDPPGDPDAPATPKHVALRRHYCQLAGSIGLAWLEDYLAALLSPKEAPNMDRVRHLREHAMKMIRAHSPRVRIANEIYLGRYFDERLLMSRHGLAEGPGGPARYFFFGVAASVVADLLSPEPALLDRLIERTGSDNYALHLTREGNYGPVMYVGLTDGVLRIDLVSMAQALDEDLDVPEL